ncbi:MAG TPA: hypothetical protein VNN17_04825 [Terriglobia bacterium]|nr:hypothetical protein [Terriglobia bacterium]
MFEPRVLREAAERIDATLLLIQVIARGRIVEEASKHYFLAGENRFELIEPPANAPPLPEASQGEISVIGSVDDSVEPMRLKIVQSKPVER